MAALQLGAGAGSLAGLASGDRVDPAEISAALELECSSCSSSSHHGDAIAAIE